MEGRSRSWASRPASTAAVEACVAVFDEQLVFRIKKRALGGVKFASRRFIYWWRRGRTGYVER